MDNLSNEVPNQEVFRCIQGCGESFYRVYNSHGQVVMTANAGRQECGSGIIPISVIWKQDGVLFNTAASNAMIEAVRQRVIDGPIPTQT